MSIRTDDRMFSGGAVTWNTQPNVNVYAQILAKKQAKMDALDEYDKQRINHINPTGVRDNDREGLDKRVAQIQEFYQGNKDKIRKGGTPESYAYEKMFRDVSSYVNQSKERTAKQDAGMKLFQERFKLDGRVPDDFMKELHENDSPIDALSGVDPVTGQPRKTQSLDLTKWLSQPKPFNQQTYLKSFGDIKRTTGAPIYSPVQGNPLKLTETTEEVFDNGAKGVIAARAADKYQNSFSFAEQVKTEVSNPLSRKRLEDTFKQEFGTDPTQPEDYATAFTMELLQPKISKGKTIDNKEAIMDRQEKFKKEQQARAAANSLSRLYVYANIQDRKPENIERNIDGVIANHIETASNDPNNEVVVDNETFKSITGEDKTSSSVLMYKDGKYQYGVKDVDGKVTVSGETPKDLAKIKLTKTFKSGLDSRYNTGNVKTPTVTKDTKGRPPLTNFIKH